MKKIIFCLGLVFLLIYILPLGIRPMVIPDETRYAEIPREMITTGDWVVPHFDGLRYFEKPVMGYWLNALSIKTFGENAFAIRFPSAMAAGLSALMIFLCLSRFMGNPTLGIIAAGIYLTSLEVFCVGVFSVLDSMVSFFLSATMVLFYMAWTRRKSITEYIIYLVLSGIFCGLACHTKGFLALVFPAIVIVPFVFWEKEGKQLLTMPFIPLITAVLVVLPWGYLIQHKEPAFWDFFFWNEHIRRFLSGNAQHKRSFFYFFMVLPLGALPWSVLWPSAFSGLKKEGMNHSFLRFAVCWLVFPFLFFSASSGKLATYILPCFPPLVMLMAVGLSGYFKSGDQKVFNRGAIGLAVFFAILGLSMVIIQTGVIKRLTVYQNYMQPFLFVMSLIIFSGVLVASAKKTDKTKKIAMFAMSPLLFYFVAHFLMPNQVISEQSPGALLDANRALVNEKTILVSSAPPIGAMCWSLKRQDIYLLIGGGELDYGLSFEDSKQRLLSLEQFNDLVNQNKGLNRVVLLIDAGRYKDWHEKLPVPQIERVSGKKGYILACY